MLPHLFQHILHKTHVPVFFVLFVLLPSNLKTKKLRFFIPPNQWVSPNEFLQTRDPYPVSTLERSGQQSRQKKGSRFQL